MLMHLARRRVDRDSSGLTFVELIMVALILAILAMAAMPLATYVHRRSKEAELKRALRVLRSSIDRYHEYATNGQIQAWDVSWDMYPKDLDMLVDGVEVTEGEAAQPFTVRFLREIPWDPITESRDWGLRSYRDEPDSTSWGGENLYDVFCLSDEEALDGTPYNEW
jgi:general secretion pathway protein G